MNRGGRGVGWEGGFEPTETHLYTEAWGGVQRSSVRFSSFDDPWGHTTD